MAKDTTGLEDFVKGYGCLAVLALIGSGVYWMYLAVFGANVRQTDEQALKKTENARRAVLASSSSVFPNADIRIEERAGENLRIYLPRTSFLDIAYPDRDRVVEAAAKSWCDGVEKTHLPGVSFRDIRTGEELASYSCSTGHASLNQ